MEGETLLEAPVLPPGPDRGASWDAKAHLEDDLDEPLNASDSEEGGMPPIGDAKASGEGDGGVVRCRICHSSEGKLFRPCQCNGSIAHIHQECLLQWLSVRNKDTCEVCNTLYRFEPVYAAEAPVSPGAIDVCYWATCKAARFSPILIRCALVSASWFGIVPLLTALMWDLCFVDSVQGFLSIGSLDLASLWRCLRVGVCLCFVVLVATVLVATFRDIIHEEQQEFLPGALPPQNVEDDVMAGADGLGEAGDADADPALLDGDADDIPFQMWVGFEGPPRFFFVHITSVLLYNALFLLTAVFAPICIGRFMLFSIRARPEVALRAVFDGLSPVITSGVLGQCYTPNAAQLEAVWEALPKENLALLLAGYSTLIVLTLLRGVATALLNIDDLPFLGLLCRLTNYILIATKFMMLLGFELGVFPVYLGWCLDYLLLDLVEATWKNRIEFFHSSPITSVAVHWFVGINFVLYVGFVASLLRKTIKRRILSRFLRHPDDPDFQPFHDFIYVPLPTHVRRLLVSGSIYTLLAIAFVHIPAKIVSKACPWVLPLRWSLGDGRGDVPVEILLFHFALPAMVSNVDLKGSCLGAVRGWFCRASTVLGLDRYLLQSDVLREHRRREREAGADFGVVMDEGFGGDVEGVNDDDDEEEEEEEEKEEEKEDGKIQAQAPAHGDQDLGEQGAEASDEKVLDEQVLDDEEGPDEEEPPKISSEVENGSAVGLGTVSSQGELQDESYNGPGVDGPRSRAESLDDFDLVLEGSSDEESSDEGSSASEEQGDASQPQESQDDDNVVGDMKEESDFGDERKANVNFVVEGALQDEAFRNPIDGAINDGAINDDNTEILPPNFALRLFMLLTATWVSHTLVLITLTLVPVLLGRTIIISMSSSLSRHDLYAILIGLYATYVLGASARRLARYAGAHDITSIMRAIARWCALGIQYSILCAFVLGVIPLLLGVLFDACVIIPGRIFWGAGTWHESPRYVLGRDWVLGIVFLKGGVQMLLAGHVGNPEIREAVQHVFRAGPAGLDELNFSQLMVDAVLPVTHRLLLLLCAPYAVVTVAAPAFLHIALDHEGVVKLLGLSMLKNDQIMYDLTVLETTQVCVRVAYLVALDVLVASVAVKVLSRSYVDLKQALFEERYLVGKRLQNYNDDEVEAKQRQTEGGAVDAVQG